MRSEDQDITPVCMKTEAKGSLKRDHDNLLADAAYLAGVHGATTIPPVYNTPADSHSSGSHPGGPPPPEDPEDPENPQSYIDPYDPEIETWYVVWAGIRVGVFSSWYVPLPAVFGFTLNVYDRAEASTYVIGVSRSSFQSFSSYATALQRFRSAERRGIVHQLRGPRGL